MFLRVQVMNDRVVIMVEDNTKILSWLETDRDQET